MPGEPDPLYVRARAALLDATDALAEQIDALVLVGAQAIYLHTGDAQLAVAEYTTDADFTIGPADLADITIRCGCLSSDTLAESSPPLPQDSHVLMSAVGEAEHAAALPSLRRTLDDMDISQVTMDAVFDFDLDTLIRGVEAHVNKRLSQG